MSAAGRDIRVLGAHLVASWTWSNSEEVCGICHVQLDGCAPEVEFPGDDSPVVWGRCSHSFHLSCIMKWLQGQRLDRQACPMCRQPWDLKTWEGEEEEEEEDAPQ